MTRAASIHRNHDGMLQISICLQLLIQSCMYSWVLQHSVLVSVMNSSFVRPTALRHQGSML